MQEEYKGIETRGDRKDRGLYRLEDRRCSSPRRCVFERVEDKDFLIVFIVALVSFIACDHQRLYLHEDHDTDREAGTVGE